MNKLLLMLTLLCVAANGMGKADANGDEAVWRYVDPRIGSVGVGRTFPGPCMPFGMAKPGPDCGVQPNAGWAPMPEAVLGFSQTHVSGTGGGQKYGNILIQPLLGNGGQQAQRRTDETIALGYYATTYDSGIRTEITTDERCTYYRIHYPHVAAQAARHVAAPSAEQSAVAAALLVDATHFLGKDSVPNLRERQQFVGAEVELFGSHEVRGFSRVRGGWNNGDAYTVYFSLQTDVPFEATEAAEGRCLLAFADTLVNIRIGISYVSALQAHRNIGPADFDTQLQRLRSSWNGYLSKVSITATDVQKRMFYTALYHTMLMPVDKSGENPKWTDAPYYDDYYAIWDTYRTSMPLLTLLCPARQADMVNALLNIYTRAQYLPDARSGDCNGRTQGGSNADVVIADAFAKGLGRSAMLGNGIAAIDYELAFEAMLKDAEEDPGADHERHGRGGLEVYKQLGYVPYGIPRAGTRTVEYAFCDWCVAQVARGLGYDETAEKYLRRSQNWRNLWRADYEYDGMRGFILPRDAEGHWLDSVAWGNSNGRLAAGQRQHKISYTPTTKVAPWYVPWWNTFFYEATSEEYSLFVPHDVEGLIAACGGPDAFRQRLDLFFDKGYYNVENEPSFLTPCLYHWLGRPDLSTARIHTIVENHYSDRPDGLPGNDDSGAMSSWLAFHLMGLYPLAGTADYLLNLPMVDAYTLRLSNGRLLSVVKEHSSKGDTYGGATLNGREITGARISHQQLMEGGELRFYAKQLAERCAPKAKNKRETAEKKRGKGRAEASSPSDSRSSFVQLFANADAAQTISFTLNRQFRTWPFACAWQGDTLVVKCKDTFYTISRREVEETDVFCWDHPQVDGTIHHDVRGTFCFLSRRALHALEAEGRTVYDGVTWRKVDETPDAIHVRASDSRAEMWIARRAAFPFVQAMKNNPLGIDWQLNF